MGGYICLVCLCMYVSVVFDSSFHDVGFTQIFGQSLLLLDLDFPNLVKNGISNYLGFLTLPLWVLQWVLSECARS